jgi:hypothetical protein
MPGDHYQVYMPQPSMIHQNGGRAKVELRPLGILQRRNTMAEITVAIINASTVLTDNEVQASVPALQTQVHDHLAPVWGVDANLTFMDTNLSLPPGVWWLVILDHSAQAGALGYHDITDQGLPMGKVFAGDDLQYGVQWTVSASHELLEMLVDPEINRMAFVHPGWKLSTIGIAGWTFIGRWWPVYAPMVMQTGIFCAYEICDACEADQFGYNINGTLVSDFVLPAWFESFRAPGSTQFDYQNQMQRPFEVLPGGYISLVYGAAGTGWNQFSAQGGPYEYRMRPHVGSRRERRRTPKDQWLKSKEPNDIAAQMTQYDVLRRRTERHAQRSPDTRRRRHRDQS